jgi:single-strand DNA-binding protein
MASFNKVMLMGNLTRDPQMRYLPNQTAVADFGLACNRRWKTPNGEDKEEVLFVDCTAWGKQAETINQYCQKGKPIFIEGRLKYDTWEDKNGGGKRHKITVVVEEFRFIGSRDGAAGAPPAAAVAAAAAATTWINPRPRVARLPRPSSNRVAPRLSSSNNRRSAKKSILRKMTSRSKPDVLGTQLN